MRGSLAAQQLSLLFQIVRQVLGDEVALASQEGRRLERSRHAHGAVPLEQAAPRLDGSGHRDGRGPRSGIASWPRDLTSSMVASSPERPAPIKPIGVAASAGQMIAMRSPPMDVMCG